MRYMTFAMAFGVGLALYPAAQSRHSHHHRPVVVVDTPFLCGILPGLWITTSSPAIATGRKTIVSIHMVRRWHLATLSRGAPAPPESVN
jgi:hypothetical protein